MKNFLIINNYINICLGLLFLILLPVLNIAVIQAIWSILIFISLLLIVFLDRKTLIKPITFFSFSVIVFLWARLILNVFFHTSIVEAGTDINSKNILISSIILGISVSIMMLSYILSNHSFDKFLDGYITKPKIKIPNYLVLSIVIMSILLVSIFLLDSFRKMSIVMSSNYLEVAGTSLLSSGIKFFTLAKLLIIVWIIFGINSKRFYYGSLILCIGSIGFLLIGLRGYAYCYFFLWLYFQNYKKEIKISRLFIFGIVLIMISNIVLEYRLGFSVSHGLLNIIIDTFHSQGASFEVVFGAIIFKKDLLSLVTLPQFLLHGNFGHYVDVARGVNFQYGGFASSWFAEAYYLGAIPFILLSILFGMVLSILDRISRFTFDNKNSNLNNYINIILFLTLPNLVFFARSTVFDLISKFIESLLIISFIILMFTKTKTEETI